MSVNGQQIGKYQYFLITHYELHGGPKACDLNAHAQPHGLSTNDWSGYKHSRKNEAILCAYIPLERFLFLIPWIDFIVYGEKNLNI